MRVCCRQGSEFDEPNNHPNSGTVDFWDEWQDEIPANRLDRSVDNWRKQNIQ